MKVCQIVPVYPPEKGGMGAVAHAYAEVLKEHGHEVTVVAASSPWAVFRFGNAAMIPSLLWRVRDFDVIHLHYPFYGAAEFVALGAWLYRVPLVVTYHMEATGSGLLGAFFCAPILRVRTGNYFLLKSFDSCKAAALAFHVKTLPGVA